MRFEQFLVTSTKEVSEIFRSNMYPESNKGMVSSRMSLTVHSFDFLSDPGVKFSTALELIWSHFSAILDETVGGGKVDKSIFFFV